MKQEVYTNGQKASSTPVPTTRYRTTPRTKDNPTTDSSNRVRPKSVTPVTAPSNTTRRSINFNRVRPVPVLGVPLPVSTDEDKCKELLNRVDLSENTVKELQRRVETSENSVEKLQGEVSELRIHCQRLKGVNSELEAQKKRLEVELAAAKEKIRQLEINAQVVQFCKNVNDLKNAYIR
jgi:peptidoglycan hydrolase CwlO-like protein